MKLIEEVDLANTDINIFKRKFATALVLTKDHEILLQMRAEDCKSFPGCLSTFGGGIEDGETPEQALIRELREELGAQINTPDIISLGAVTEAITNHTEILYVYYWHDRSGTITGCYEGSPALFNNTTSIINHPKVMDYVIWSLDKCKSLDLLI